MSHPPNGETVVLLHGIARTGMSMLKIKQSLKRDGYNVINITYPSTKMPLQDIAGYIQRQLEVRPEFNDAAKAHFVTHSMGGLVALYYLGKNRPENLGRVAMLGPPNKGSEFADFMLENEHLRPLFEMVFGPAGSELTTTHRHSEDVLKIDYEVGVIAGSSSVNPLATMVLGDFGDAHDGIVPIANTVLDQMADHIVIPTTHSFMMYSPHVIAEVKEFLRNGRFSLDAPRLPQLRM